MGIGILILLLILSCQKTQHRKNKALEELARYANSSFIKNASFEDFKDINTNIVTYTLIGNIAYMRLHNPDDPRWKSLLSDVTKNRIDNSKTWW